MYNLSLNIRAVGTEYGVIGAHIAYKTKQPFRGFVIYPLNDQYQRLEPITLIGNTNKPLYALDDIAYVVKQWVTLKESVVSGNALIYAPLKIEDDQLICRNVSHLVWGSDYDNIYHSNLNYVLSQLHYDNLVTPPEVTEDATEAN
jgi:hypothetical protein